MNSEQIDVASATVLRRLKVGKQPRGMVMAKAGTLYVASFYGDSIDVLQGTELEVRHRLSVCKCPRHLAPSPDDRTLDIWCLNASELHAIDLASETVTHMVPIGKAPKSIDVSRDGRYVYSADYGESRSVSVVDTRDWTSRVLSPSPRWTAAAASPSALTAGTRS